MEPINYYEPWTTPEIKFLRENYRKNNLEYIMKKLGRNKQSIYVQAHNIGLKMINSQDLIHVGNVTYKRCSRCGGEFTLDNFVRQSAMKSGFSSACKKCRKKDNEKRKSRIIWEARRAKALNGLRTKGITRAYFGACFN